MATAVGSSALKSRPIRSGAFTGFAPRIVVRRNDFGCLPRSPAARMNRHTRLRETRRPAAASPERSKLAAIAQQRAAVRAGVTFGNEATVLVGDTPKDVEAGLAAGVRVIGVATGKTSQDQLQKAGATATAADLKACLRTVRTWIADLGA